MRQATTLSYVRIPLLLPNIYVRTAPNDYYPISDVQLSQFTGAVWRPLQGYMRNPRTFAEPTNDVAQSDRRDVPAATQAADAPAAATDTKLPAPPTTASVPATPASK